MLNASINTPLASYKSIKIGKKNDLLIISGPNVLEKNNQINIKIAKEMKQICKKNNFQYVFKASYYKPNRTDKGGYLGPEIEEGYRKLNEIKKKAKVFITTDVHSAEEAKIFGEICDIIQIPAAMSKHLDIIYSAGKSGKIVNIKKGQWLAPWEMKNVIERNKEKKLNKIIITERGTFHGYRNLVTDFKSFPIIKSLGVPVIADFAHSLAFAEGNSQFVNGNTGYFPFFLRSAISCGVDGIFFETHPNPKKALANGQATISLKDAKTLLNSVKDLAKLSKKFRS